MNNKYQSRGNKLISPGIRNSWEAGKQMGLSPYYRHQSINKTWQDFLRSYQMNNNTPMEYASIKEDLFLSPRQWFQKYPNRTQEDYREWKLLAQQFINNSYYSKAAGTFNEKINWLYKSMQ